MMVDRGVGGGKGMVGKGVNKKKWKKIARGMGNDLMEEDYFHEAKEEGNKREREASEDMGSVSKVPKMSAVSFDEAGWREARSAGKQPREPNAYFEF